MNTSSNQGRVRLCSKCQGDTEYFCVSCQCDLCLSCKENHVIDLKTLNHYVFMFREKTGVLKQYVCEEHQNKLYKNYCAICQVPVCNYWLGHRSHRFPFISVNQKQHKLLNIQTIYRIRRNQCRKFIDIIRSEALFVRQFLLAEVKADIEICLIKFSQFKSDMIPKANIIKNNLDRISWDSVCLLKKTKLNKQLFRIKNYENNYDQLTGKPVQTLLFLKKAILPKTKDTPIFALYSKLLTSDSLNKENVIMFLGHIKISDIEKQRCTATERMLTLTAALEFQRSFTVTGVRACYHISQVTSDQAWISDKNSLILVKMTDEKTHHRRNFEHNVLGNGFHTVNNENELIYIDKYTNIRKLPNYMTRTETFIDNTEPIWEPQCVGQDQRGSTCCMA